MDTNTEVKESLKEEMTSVIGEARMVIPGIQALFGFQTMAVFNNRFESLPESSKWAYLVALGLLTLAIGLLMTPAAYHRLAQRGFVSRKLIDLSSNLVSAGMVPLLLAFAIDIYVVIVAAVDNPLVACFAAAATACVLGALWFAFPWARNKNTR